MEPRPVTPVLYVVLVFVILDFIVDLIGWLT
jgi:hypothetical protein